jgi:purine-binding chemotaxis protein CheW
LYEKNFYPNRGLLAVTCARLACQLHQGCRCVKEIGNGGSGLEKTNSTHDIDGELNQLISFSVGVEEYGMDILRVKEVIRTPQLTHLPKAPSFVKGIINLRGDVIPIVDLRDKFGLESQAHDASTRIIVVDVEGRLVGLVVDSASQVVRIPSDQIDPPPPIIGGLSTEYIRGVGKLDDRLIILLNIDTILSDSELKELDSVQPTTAGVTATVS